jgi:hypothetical protein
MSISSNAFDVFSRNIEQSLGRPLSQQESDYLEQLITHDDLGFPVMIQTLPNWFNQEALIQLAVDKVQQQQSQLSKETTCYSFTRQDYATVLNKLVELMEEDLPLEDLWDFITKYGSSVGIVSDQVAEQNPAFYLNYAKDIITRSSEEQLCQMVREYGLRFSYSLPELWSMYQILTPTSLN